MVLEINFEEVLGPPLPAATVMVLRDGSDGLEVLMLRRHADSGVLGGVHVFPGGKLDASDLPTVADALDRPMAQLHAALCEPALDSATAAGLHVAALRETLEECGLLLGQVLEAQALTLLREQLRSGQGLLAALAQLGLKPTTTVLAPWSRWITPRVPSITRKRFDTRFFVAAAPAAQLAAHDNHETTETVWLHPREGLRQYWERVIELAPPQIMSLSQLARFDRVDAVLAAARARPPALIEPLPFELDGERVICYPGDPRHGRSEAALPGPTRLTYRNQRFEPEGGLAALLPAD